MKHLRDDPALRRILQAQARQLAIKSTTTAAERRIDRDLNLQLAPELRLADPRLLDIERIIVNSTSILKRLSGETQ
jgi:hypothetical protein